MIDISSACEAAGSVLGKKKAMIAHILGGEKPCRHASQAALSKAKSLQKEIQSKGKKVKRGRESDEDEAEEEEVLDELLDTESELSKKQIVEPAPPSSKPKLKGIIRPFTSSYFPTAGPSNIADKITINV